MTWYDIPCYNLIYYTYSWRRRHQDAQHALHVVVDLVDAAHQQAAADEGHGAPGPHKLGIRPVFESLVWKNVPGPWEI